MNHLVARLTAAAGAAALLVTLPLAAQGSTRPTAADKSAMRAANVACFDVEAESAYEDCVIGHFVLARRRYVDSRDYTTSFDRAPSQFVLLTHASRKV